MTNNNQRTMERMQRGLKKRYAAERRFKTYGQLAIIIGLSFLVVLFSSIIGNGWRAFQQTFVAVEIYFDPAKISVKKDQTGTVDVEGNFQALVKASLRESYPDVKKRRKKRALYHIISSGAAFQLRDMVIENPDLLGQKRLVWVPADDDIDMLQKGYISRDQPESSRRLKDYQIKWVDQLVAKDKIELRFNFALFTNGDSREPELAGVWGATVGTYYTLLITLLLAFPIGIAAAVYLEEFAPSNRYTDIIEININNLAAVPSIVFGLLGLAVFISFFGMPRSAPIVGGLVLTLMTLPTIIISSRAALAAVPPSIREAAFGIGASKVQAVFHHVVPLAMPGMLTGAIIGMSRALGETAPLLMIGMVAFIVDIPGGPMDPATALPVQIYLWVDSPERAFVERTSAAIMILLGFLVVMNGTAVYLRKRFERRW